MIVAELLHHVSRYGESRIDSFLHCLWGEVEHRIATDILQVLRHRLWGFLEQGVLLDVGDDAIDVALPHAGVDLPGYATL